MPTLLQFIARIAPLLYGLIALGILVSLRGLARARRLLRIAAFGLEREAAYRQLRSSTSTLVTLVLLAGAVYVIDGVLAPRLNDNTAAGEIMEPTPAVFVTQEPTSTPARLLFPTVTPTVGVPPAEAEAVEAGPTEEAEGCTILGATITSPTAGRAVSGQVAVEGEANVLDFAQYKFELKGPATGDSWIVVGTYVAPVTSGLLGVWDATSLPPGNYTLRLIILRGDGSYVTPCEVPIVIVSPSS
jgi:hypothetical protein